ncbi:hypothetical protein [Gordonia neofelifaecis]|uniref:Uncharacterized protein n=1 Tax=Gordonia neofelifaecis NRRL B-59395 TaxID=644548 RepID=F1YH13_9ACTN|nr:hypothetical protein [Gordonia neofelifaecis]EGD55928.1 hypothetical protein SCNU_06800 [Gordonia neofelifaecis NRRL B-59395]
MNAKSEAAQQFSFAKLVFYSLGAGVLTLAVLLPVVLLLARPYPTAALCVAIGSILAMVVVIALVSRRMMSGIQREIDLRRAELERRRAAEEN